MRTLYEVGRIIEDLKKDKERLLERERKISVYSVLDGEDREDMRPEYDYDSIKEEIKALDKKIRTLTYSAMKYFVTEKVAEHGDMTLDELLVYLRQLQDKADKLYAMSTHLNKERKGADPIEYEYVNYDIKRVEEEYQKTKKEIDRTKFYTDFYVYELAFDTGVDGL